MGIWLTWKVDGITITGIHFESDTVVGNMNFYASIEGFMESLPQCIYQSSIMLRTPYEEWCKYKQKDLFLRKLYKQVHDLDEKNVLEYSNR